MSKKKKAVIRSNAELAMEIRGTWGAVNPVTRVIPNKKAYDRKKSKAALRDYCE